jgi:hypothetical protein
LAIQVTGLCDSKIASNHRQKSWNEYEEETA